MGILIQEMLYNDGNYYHTPCIDIEINDKLPNNTEIDFDNKNVDGTSFKSSHDKDDEVSDEEYDENSITDEFIE